MPLPNIGSSISLSQVNVELGLSSTATISMNDSAVRTLFGVGGSGTAISMDQGFGKENIFAFSIASNTANVDLRTSALSAGWNGTTKVQCTINSGVVVFSNSVGSYALTISGSFPGGVSLINSGVIVGRGGNGGAGAAMNNFSSFGANGGDGGTGAGPALNVSTAVSITNNNIIGGGGGGGGGGRGGAFGPGCGFSPGNGGGGGGGIGGGTGGAGRGPSGWGDAPSGPGGAGTITAAGGGGSPGGGSGNQSGGAGGSYGASGNTGNSTEGGWSTFRGPFSGGAGGAAVVGNGNITWVSTGQRYGSIS
jgi:hypothetical protein